MDSLTSTAFTIDGYQVVESLGVVRGISVRSRNIFGTIGASFQTLLGGNITLLTSLCEKARADAAERASFDPFFTFFLGGVAVFEDGVRVGAVGVSGLPGDVDEQLALGAIERSAGV